MSHTGPARSPPPGPRYVSTAQVADALRVSVSTVKRWVDGGVLHAHKTAGGHRKLLLVDVVRLAREKNLPRADLGALVAGRADAADAVAARKRFAAAGRAGDAAAVRDVILGAYLGGLSVAAIADRVVAPAMAAIGHDWAGGRLGILPEHRATQATLSAVYELKGMLRADVAADRPVAVGGAPEGDHYSLATLLAKMTLIDGGWDAVNLGPHTPMAVFREAVEGLAPGLVWVSVGQIDDADRFVDEYGAFFEWAQGRGVAVAVGGRALTEAVRVRLPYTTYGDGMEHLAAFARQLHPRKA